MIKTRIAAVGIIAAGKTSACKAICEFHPQIKLFEEPSFHNPYLAKFYEEPKKYAYLMQCYLFNKRKQSSKLAIQYQQQGKLCLHDTCLSFDWTYAYLNYKFENNINEKDFKKYMKMYTEKTTKYSPPDRIVYLKCDPKIALKRIKLRAKQQKHRESETSIKLQYLINQQKSLEEWISRMRNVTDVVEVDWDEFDRNISTEDKKAYYTNLFFG